MADSISVATSKEFERRSVAKAVTSRCTPRKLFDLKSLVFEGVELASFGWRILYEPVILLRIKKELLGGARAIRP